MPPHIRLPSPSSSPPCQPPVDLLLRPIIPLALAADQGHGGIVFNFPALQTIVHPHSPHVVRPFTSPLSTVLSMTNDFHLIVAFIAASQCHIYGFHCVAHVEQTILLNFFPCWWHQCGHLSNHILRNVLCGVRERWLPSGRRGLWQDRSDVRGRSRQGRWRATTPTPYKGGTRHDGEEEGRTTGDPQRGNNHPAITPRPRSSCPIMSVHCLLCYIIMPLHLSCQGG